MFDEHHHGDYIIYGDESGDHSMDTLSKDHPVFALALCVFSKHEYVDLAVKHFKEFKFLFWGHDAIILHSAKLRKQIEDFQFLQNPKRREIFIEKLNAAVLNSPFTIISTSIDKRLLKEKYLKPENPYELSLEYCLERVYRFLKEKNQIGRTTYIIIESRGNEVDTKLNIAFNKIKERNKTWQERYPIKVLFVDKKSNSIGLQIADLVVYPIGRFAVNPQKENPAFNIIQRKLHKYPDYLGKGLKIFPTEKTVNPSEKRKAPEFSEALGAD